MKKIKHRIVARYVTRRIDGYWWAQAYDTGSKRYCEADVKGQDHMEVKAQCRDRINNSYSAKNEND